LAFERNIGKTTTGYQLNCSPEDIVICGFMSNPLGQKGNLGSGSGSYCMQLMLYERIISMVKKEFSTAAKD
jgi:hypothetical protein